MGPWLTIYHRFDPEVPALSPSWRTDRKDSPAAAITTTPDELFAGSRWLIRGTFGTGKSTELLRIAEALSARELVVGIDLNEHFSKVVGDSAALERVQPWEVVFLAGLAVLRVADELKLTPPIPKSHVADLSKAWERLAGASGISAAPGVDLGKLAGAMFVLASAAVPALAVPVSAAAATGAGLKTLAAAADSVKWTLPFGLAKRSLSDQDAETRTMLGAVNAIIAHVQQEQTKMRVLVLLDGLDRITDLDRARLLFLDSEMLAKLVCPTVVSGPFALRHSPAAAKVKAFTKNFVLANLPVLDAQHPDRPGPGIAFFHNLYRKRTTDLPDLISSELLDKLAYYSGGRVRDFVKSIRLVAEHALRDGADRVASTHVDKALREARLLLESGLNRGHIDILEQIAADPEHRCPDGEKVRELLTYGQLLPYPNESEWFYPHPLLTMHLIRIRKTGSNG